MIKLLMCITKSETGGSQQVVFDILSNLPADLYEITLVTAPGGTLLDRVEELNKTRDNKIQIQAWKCLKRNLSPFHDFAALVKLIMLMKRSHFDVAHFHNSKVGILGRLAATIAGMPKVYYTVHGWGLNRNTTGRMYNILSHVERFVAHCCTGIIFVSKSDMEKGIRNKWASEPKAHLIYNGVSDMNPQLAGPLDIPRDVPILSFVARLSEPKEPLFALKASEQLYKEGYKHMLLIIGDGPMYAECADYISAHHLQKHAAMLGMRNDVRALLHYTDIFCLFSKWEGLPVSILEAMVAGLPVVASAVGGIPELVKDGQTGFLVPHADMDTAVASLKALLDNRILRAKMGEAARSLASRQFDLSDMVSQYRELYEYPVVEHCAAKRCRRVS